MPTHAGAAFDLHDREPPDFDRPVFACENLVTTPHVAAVMIEAQTAMAVQVASEIRPVRVDDVPPARERQPPSGAGTP